MVLREYDPKAGSYTGREYKVEVTYIVRAPDWGLPNGIVVMSIQPSQGQRWKDSGATFEMIGG